MTIYSNLDKNVIEKIIEYQEENALDFLRNAGGVGVTPELISNLVNDLTAINHAIADYEHELLLLEHEYKQELLHSKYSEEYQKYKTIKEKEERATMEHAETNEIIIDTKYLLYKLKANRDGLIEDLRLMHKLLPEVLDNGCSNKVPCEQKQ